MDVIAKLNDVLTDEKNRPYQDIRITHTVILHDPYPDPENLECPDVSPRPTADILASDYIAVHEDIEDTEGKDITQINEEIQSKEAEARATILEMVGDLPDADMAPPENVLFVCKLNPVTTSDDLEIIFSRFGKINCAEVIKDSLTGNSLQYAFIEFDNKKSCEDAYFKMDNVLIDDRRIHVDFSQSVSKIKWRGRGRGVNLFDNKGKKIENRPQPKPQIKSSEKKSRFINAEEYSKRYEEQNENPVNFRNVDKKFNGNRHYRDRGENLRTHDRNRHEERERGYHDRRNDESDRRTNHKDRYDDRSHYNNDRYHNREDDKRHRGRYHGRENEERVNGRRDNDSQDQFRNRPDRQEYRENWRDDRAGGHRSIRDHRHQHNTRPERHEEDNHTVKSHHRGDDRHTHQNEGLEERLVSQEDKRDKLLRKLKEDMKRKKRDDSSDSSSSSVESSPEKKKKKKRKHKKRQSSSDSDSSDSDDEEVHKSKKRKKSKKSKKKKSKKSKH